MVRNPQALLQSLDVLNTFNRLSHLRPTNIRDGQNSKLTTPTTTTTTTTSTTTMTTATAQQSLLPICRRSLVARRPLASQPPRPPDPGCDAVRWCVLASTRRGVRRERYRRSAIGRGRRCYPQMKRISLALALRCAGCIVALFDNACSFSTTLSLSLSLSISFARHKDRPAAPSPRSAFH